MLSMRRMKATSLPKPPKGFTSALCSAAQDHVKKLSKDLDEARSGDRHPAEVRRLEKLHASAMAHYQTMKCPNQTVTDMGKLDVQR